MGDIVLKKSFVNLHMSRKRTLFLIASFSLVSSILYLFAAIPSKTNLMQLNSLLQSDYLYSATVGKTDEPDAYYQYNAGISFAISADSKTSINADVVMQTAESEYTDSVFWNAGRLYENEIALSEGIARQYGLRKGDFLYSKNVVDNTICEYCIKQILSDVVSVRILKGKSFTDGIIVMGYDSNYTENVTHNILLFTDKAIDEVSAKSPGMMSDIIYRDDEIKYVCEELVPYYLLLLVIAIVLTVGLAIVLKRAISYNFKRLITLGFSQKSLNASYYNLFWGAGFTSIVTSFIISLSVCGIAGLNIVEVILLLSVVIVECITLLIEVAFIKRQLWSQ